MCKKLMLLMLCALMLATPPIYAEETTALMEYTVRNGKKQAHFEFPESCYIMDDGNIGVFVFLNSSNYVAVSIPGRGLSGTEKLRENIGDDEKICVLSDDIYVFATHGDMNHRRPYVDIVSVGINLPDGTGIIANAESEYGRIEVYDLLLTIVGSMTDSSLLEVWINNEWLPQLTEN